MNRKEAIFELRHTQMSLDGCHSAKDYVDAIGIAIEALEDIYGMSNALDSVTSFECCTYGFDCELKHAMKWIERG